MKRQVGVAVLALALCGGVQAQTNEQLKQMLDQALKTIDDLKGRVKALEDDKQKSAVVATPAAAASAPPAWGAPVVSVAVAPGTGPPGRRSLRRRLRLIAATRFVRWFGPARSRETR